MTAFHGDPATKTRLMDQITRHAQNGTLVPGATFWDGSRGSPLGILTQGGDAAGLADVCGYPLALAGLLDPWTAVMTDPDSACGFAREWVERAEPGADLSNVPTRIVLAVLDRVTPDEQTAAIAHALKGLHHADLAGTSARRSEWAALRQQILAVQDNAPETASPLIELYEMASWPARSSHSILSSLGRAWCNLVELEPTPDWSEEDRARADALLKQLWGESSAQREAGDDISYPKLFAGRDPDLAARFEANLRDVNQRYETRMCLFGQLALDGIAGLLSEEDLQQAKAGFHLSGEQAR
jgi:hypothetical protein